MAQLSPTLRPLWLELESVEKAAAGSGDASKAEVARLGQVICTRLQALPPGEPLTEEVLDKLAETAVAYLPLTPAADAVAGARAAWARSPADLPQRDGIRYLPLQVTLTVLTRQQRAIPLGAAPNQRQARLRELAVWFHRCLLQYQQAEEPVPVHLWWQIQNLLTELDPSGEVVRPVLHLLIQLTPGQPPRLPDSLDTPRARLMKPPEPPGPR